MFVCHSGGKLKIKKLRTSFGRREGWCVCMCWLRPRIYAVVLNSRLRIYIILYNNNSSDFWCDKIAWEKIVWLAKRQTPSDEIEKGGGGVYTIILKIHLVYAYNV